MALRGAGERCDGSVSPRQHDGGAASMKRSANTLYDVV